jgi:hypothetical protein
VAKIPRNYIVRGGGDWLDIDYSHIDFNHAGVTPARTDDGYLVHADERTPSGLLDPGDVTLEIGRGFETKEVAEAELQRLRESVESDLP